MHFSGRFFLRFYLLGFIVVHFSFGFQVIHFAFFCEDPIMCKHVTYMWYYGIYRTSKI